MSRETEVKANLTRKWIADVMEYFADKGEDVMQVASNAIAFPTIDEDNNDRWIKVTISIPTGARGGDGYDGYEEAEQYAFDCEQKAKKEKELAEKAEKKRIADEAKRAKLAAEKAAREAAKAEAEN